MTRPPNTPPASHSVFGLLTAKQAAAWLKISLRALSDRADIPRLDVAAPGAARPQWRYRLEDLQEFAACRVLLPYRAHDRYGAKGFSAPY